MVLVAGLVDGKKLAFVHDSVDKRLKYASFSENHGKKQTFVHVGVYKRAFSAKSELRCNVEGFVNESDLLRKRANSGGFKIFFIIRAKITPIIVANRVWIDATEWMSGTFEGE